MATLDETNIFGLPLTRQYGLEPKPAPAPMSEQEQASRQEFESRIGSDNKFGLTYEGFLKAKEKKLVSDQRMQVAQALAEGDTDKAYEGFTELPMVTDQFPAYMTPVLGNIIDEKERRYFAEKAGRELKDPRDVELEMLMASDPRDVKQFTTQDPVSGAMSTLAGVSSLIGIGEGPTMLKAGIMGAFPSLRRGMVAKSMDGQGGGGGGISNIQPQPTKDYAGFVSSVERAALGPQKFGTGQDLIKYLESTGRKGVSTKELEYIDFDQIRNNPNLTKEDVIAHIQANRPKVYRIERSEDNPTYQADSSDNPLNELPFNEEASRIANLEQQAYFRDEYAQEIADHNEILTNNPTLQNSNFVLNSENINDPSVLDDLERYLKTEPEAYSGTNPTIVKYTKPDGTTGTGAYESYASIMDFPDKFDELIKLAKDGATIEFPALTRNADDILEEASAMRVSPDYGNQFEIYEAVGDNTSSIYKITGNDDTGYQVYVDDKPVRRDLGTRGGADTAYFDDLADARARVQAEAFDNGDIREDLGSIDYGSNANRMIDSLPSEVISGQATLRTRFGDEYSDYRLPMGGAENYREFTLHIENPKTATRYDSSKGTKHFGGGDELLHYRVTDRIDEDGKRVLFVEEIQSDLHSTASSTQSDATYELSAKERQKIANQLKEFGLRANTKELRGYGNFFYRGEPGTGGEKMIDIGSLPSIAKDIRAGRTSKLSYKADDFVENFGLEKTKEIGDLVTKLQEGNLPDLPYKGNDYIDLAVKDIMKLAAEGNYDRVAFTNPATQLRRNRKNLEYIDSIEVNQVPLLTPSEQSFSMDWMRNRDLSMISSMSPNARAVETVDGKLKMPNSGSLDDADLNSFVSTHTDFVVNNPQAQKFWQDFHKAEHSNFLEVYPDLLDEYMVNNLDDLVDAVAKEEGLKETVTLVFAKSNAQLSPTQVAEEVQKLLIRQKKKDYSEANKKALQAFKEANPSITGTELADSFTKFSADVGNIFDTNISQSQKVPLTELTATNVELPKTEIERINQETRRAISSIMRTFYDHSLPNVDDAGKYLVKTKGTGYKVDRDKFMIERGEIQDNYKSEKYNDLDSMIEDLRLDKKTEEIVRKDAEKGLIPVSTKDKQIYQIEAEGGSGKKPALMYANLIPKSAAKFAKKYNKDAEAKLKNVLYTSDENLSPTDLYTNFLAEQKKLRAEGQNIIQNKKVGQYDPDDYFDFEAHEAATIDITEEMRKAILEEGVNVMYKGGIVNKVKSMDKPIQGNRREM
jgi:hypothetical protein